MPILGDYRGRLIRLTGERTAHIREHAEMVTMEGGIATTLMAPHRVVRSFSDPSARLYYRLFSDTPVGEKYLCVVVRIAGDDAFVLTAYLTDSVKRGAVLWPSGM